MGKISKIINKIRGKDFEYKQVILVREDLNLPKGKNESFVLIALNTFYYSLYFHPIEA